MMIKCPVCKCYHSVREYDADDYICLNSGPTPKTFDEMEPTDQLTRGGYPQDFANTRVNEIREVTLVDLKPALNKRSDKIGKRVKNW